MRLNRVTKRPILSRTSLFLIDPNTLSDNVAPVNTFFDSFATSFSARLFGTLIGNLVAGFIFKQIAEAFSNFGKDNENNNNDGNTAQFARNSSPSQLQSQQTQSPRSISADAWIKLFICLIIDLGGDASFLLPGVGELEDAAWAPISSIALAYLFGSNTIAGIDFAKEILPFTDILPVATIAWLLQNVYYDSSLSGWLGLSVTKDKPLIPSDMSDISSFKNIKDAVDTEIVKNKNKNDDR